MNGTLSYLLILCISSVLPNQVNANIFAKNKIYEEPGFKGNILDFAKFDNDY